MPQLFDDLIRALAQEIKQELTVEENRIAFEIDGLVYDMKYQADGETVFMYAYIAEIPTQDSIIQRATVLAALYQQLLQSQYFFCKTAGFTFGVDEDANFIILQSLLPVESIREQAFVEAVEKFVQTTNVWHGLLEKLIVKYQEGHMPEIEVPSLGGDASGFIRV